jgi:8-oxo-dGTP pyrophosphatase MutT (NUDIX family)
MLLKNFAFLWVIIAFICSNFAIARVELSNAQQATKAQAITTQPASAVVSQQKPTQSIAVAKQRLVAKQATVTQPTNSALRQICTLFNNMYQFVSQKFRQYIYRPTQPKITPQRVTSATPKKVVPQPVVSTIPGGVSQQVIPATPIAVQPTPVSTTSRIQSPALGNFQFSSASVLPFYKQGSSTYFLLSQEGFGRDKGTWDDFGGSRDAGENHPIVTAAREFLEEANLDVTVGLSLAQTRNYIDVAAGNTSVIIANTTARGDKSVTYITNFAQYITQFCKNFYPAIKNATKFERREKTTIARVEWNALKNAIVSSSRNTGVTVSATVIDAQQKETTQNIILRPYLVIRLRSFFMKSPYVRGKDSKIRFYE